MVRQQINKNILFIIISLFFSVELFTGCKRDKCEGILCLHNGTCSDGTCNCEINYTGPLCNEQKTPKSITINSILVTRFPGTNFGQNWDQDGGPDIYVKIYDGNIKLFDSPNYYKDANPNHDYVFSPITVIIINPANRHSIELWDYDEGPSNDDYMGGINFFPYWSNTNGFPEYINIDAGGSVAFTLNVSYDWN